MITNKLILFALLVQWVNKECDGQEECHMQQVYEADTKGEGNYAPCYLTPFITAGLWARGWFCFNEQAEHFAPLFKSVFFQGTSVQCHLRRYVFKTLQKTAYKWVLLYIFSQGDLPGKQWTQTCTEALGKEERKHEKQEGRGIFLSCSFSNKPFYQSFYNKIWRLKLDSIH